MNSQTVMTNFSALYKDLLDWTGLIDRPSQIFNTEEWGVFNTGEWGVYWNSKVRKFVIATKSKHAYSEQKSSQDHITTMICCLASGLTSSSMKIFEKCWPSSRYSQNVPKDYLYMESSNGYLDEKLFMEWFKICVPETKQAKFLIDGHCSHRTNSMLLSYKLLSLAKDEEIYFLVLPTHTLNILQPLDVVFHPFKVNLSKLTGGLKLLAVSGSYNSINKTNFIAIFKEATDRANCLATISLMW